MFYVGIDIAKNKHDMACIDKNGRVVLIFILVGSSH